MATDKRTARIPVPVSRALRVFRASHRRTRTSPRRAASRSTLDGRLARPATRTRSFWHLRDHELVRLRETAFAGHQRCSTISAGTRTARQSTNNRLVQLRRRPSSLPLQGIRACQRRKVLALDASDSCAASAPRATRAASCESAITASSPTEPSTLSLPPRAPPSRPAPTPRHRLPESVAAFWRACASLDIISVPLSSRAHGDRTDLLCIRHVDHPRERPHELSFKRQHQTASPTLRSARSRTH